jgi:hypothetical protein
MNTVSVCLTLPTLDTTVPVLWALQLQSYIGCYSHEAMLDTIALEKLCWGQIHQTAIGHRLAL